MENKELEVRQPMEMRSFEEVEAEVKAIDKFYRQLMQSGTDYGIIPGTSKPTLLKAGAELLRLRFNLEPEFDINNTGTDLLAGIFNYEITCRLYRNGARVSEGVGACNSLESKYRYRWVYDNQIPLGVAKETLITKVSKDNKTTTYRLDNENPQDLQNTILKMGKKRAFVDAILTYTGASRIFTQDIEDFDNSAIAPEKKAAPQEQPIDPDHFCITHQQNMIDGPYGWYCKTKVVNNKGAEVWCKGTIQPPPKKDAKAPPTDKGQVTFPEDIAFPGGEPPVEAMESEEAPQPTLLIFKDPNTFKRFWHNSRHVLTPEKILEALGIKNFSEVDLNAAHQILLQKYPL